MQFVRRRILASVVVALLSATATAGPVTLHEAIAADDVAALSMILATGQDVDAPDANGEPALVSAALQGRTMIVSSLIKAGADTSARTDRGLTALHAAAFAGHSDIVELLIAAAANVDDNDNRFGIAPLHAAAEENNSDIVVLFIDAGASVEITERNGYSPITRAGWREHWEIVKLLKATGATCQPEALVGEWLYRHCTELTE